LFPLFYQYINGELNSFIGQKFRERSNHDATLDTSGARRTSGKD